jgi:hypothetical protein
MQTDPASFRNMTSDEKLVSLYHEIRTFGAAVVEAVQGLNVKLDDLSERVLRLQQKIDQDSPS